MPEYVVLAENLPRGPMVRAYLEAAEWCGVDESDCQCSYPAKCAHIPQREALEDSAQPRWSDAALKRAADDCADFLEANADDIGTEYARAGHDFWLTRNGHGAGFWDGDWPKAAGDRLTANSKPYGETSVYFDAETETLELEG